ncbi:beta strand repeat-containing protein [Adhaeretor mobilis]|uniref:PEP-CTERM protein-sorting domain-containing protein n=1 Tax=Adhaeretor mobilis TaxID=1930276 RepID=A0A517N0C0_9BACT|nr:hypothetical protein [Adhaeretor mobilis]QDT00577.1 hypothetical protein HG15A2_39150 [Adhaeretor mobilis]
MKSLAWSAGIRVSVALSLAVCLVLSCLLGNAQSAELTAVYEGDELGDPSSYKAAGNWDINQAPLNNVTDQFNVEIPTGHGVLFDVDPASQINDFTLASGSTLTVPGGHSLTVLDDALIGGGITADSTTALFQATGAGAAFAPEGAQLFATNGGTVRVAATMFTNTALSGNATQFSSSGAGSLLDLTSLLSYADSRNSNGTRSISASNNGVIDLSNLGTIAKTGSGVIGIQVASGGNVNLDGLTTVTGATRIDVDNPTYALPSLTTASGLTVDLANGSSFTANDALDYTEGAVTFEGDDAGTFTATSLTNFTNSTASMTAGQDLNVAAGGLTTINGSRFLLRGGKQYGATQITATTFNNEYFTGNTTQFSADGTGTLLDLSSLQSYADSRNSNGTRSISASNNGVIDLSNVGTITKTASGVIGIQVASGGNVNLDGLTTVTGATRIDVDNPTYALPSLTTASGLTVDLANGSSFTANDALDYTEGAVTFEGDDAGTFTATSLTNFTNSTASMTAGQDLNVAAGGLTTINGSRFLLRGGKQYGATQITATTFNNEYFTGNTTQFSADGTGTLLDLSSLQSYADSRNSNGTRSISASNNGVIDLSNVGTITKTASGVIGIQVASGGNVNLDGLTTVTGATRIDVDNPTYALPSLTTASGLTVDLANGSSFTANDALDYTEGAVTFEGDDAGTFTATSLTNFTNSTASMTAGQNLNVAAGGLTTINGSRFLLRGGKQYGATQITATTFNNEYFTGNTTQFSADGTGTLLDLSSLQSYADSRNSNGTRSIIASNNGVIDLSNVGTITKTASGGIGIQVESGGRIDLANLNTAGVVSISADGPQSTLAVSGNINLSPQSSLTLTDGAKLEVGKDLLYATTNEAQVNLDAGIVEVISVQATFLEAGGDDLGVGGTATNNFGIGRLIVGETGTPTMTFLTDLIDNGNRTSGKEALYLPGFGGPDGLELIDGSMLVLGDINAYALVNGVMTHLNSLFSVGSNVAAFSGGTIARTFPADFDFDADVDGDDLATWNSNYGTQTGADFSDGDADKDTDVDGFDFILWQRFHTGSTPSTAANVTVPEPSTLVLALGLLTLGLASRKKCSPL